MVQASIALSLQGLPLLLGSFGMTTPLGLFLTLLLLAFQPFLLGGLSDLMDRKNVLALAYLLRAMAFILPLFLPLTEGVYFFRLLNGLVWVAAVSPMIALVADIYGVRNLGALVGISFLVYHLGAITGPYLGGVLFSLTNSFALVFALLTPALLGAAVLSFLIAERRYSIRYITPAFLTSGSVNLAPWQTAGAVLSALVALVVYGLRVLDMAPAQAIAWAIVCGIAFAISGMTIVGTFFWHVIGQFAAGLLGGPGLGQWPPGAPLGLFVTVVGSLAVGAALGSAVGYTFGRRTSD